MLVMCGTKKGFEVVGDVLIHSFKQAVQDDREDCLELETATEDKELAERRPEVLEMEYPETSSAQGLAAAKAHVSEPSSESSSATPDNGANQSSSKPALGGMHLSVRLLRAASNNATFGIRSLYVGMAATEGGDHVPHSPFYSVSGSSMQPINATRSNSIHKTAKVDESPDILADESAHRSVHLLMGKLIPNIMSIVSDAKEVRAKGFKTSYLLKLSDSFMELMKDVIGDILGRPWIQDAIFRLDYDKLIDELFYLSEHAVMMDHLVKKLDRTTYLPYQLEMRWADHCTRWASLALNAFKAEANHTVLYTHLVSHLLPTPLTPLTHLVGFFFFFIRTICPVVNPFRERSCLCSSRAIVSYPPVTPPTTLISTSNTVKALTRPVPALLQCNKGLALECLLSASQCQDRASPLYTVLLHRQQHPQQPLRH